ncbi:hypothetical protein [Kitasatospora herbaricolor]|uniref:Uncharacterized protein n=1 Tax=Kitasatospora herbaricolor TaxID=68217 RepID=A0ABZ1WJH5_9ACTN|nr:hypothetical protein [Kitasatospora herbaricolor]
MAGEATFGTDSGVGSTIALLEAQLPAARERRGRLEEELAAAVARENAITSVLEGLRALSGRHLDGQADPQEAVEAPATDPIPTPSPSPAEAAEPVTSASDGQATATEGRAEGRADAAPASSEPAATPVAKPVAKPAAKRARKTAGRGTTTRAAAAATKRTAATKADAGRRTTAGKTAVVTGTTPEPEQGISPAAVAVAKKATRKSAPKAAPEADPKDTGPGTVKKATSVKAAAPRKAAPRKESTAKAVPAKAVSAKAVPATGKAAATLDAPAAAAPAPVSAPVSAPVNTAPAKAASTPGRRRLTDAEGVLAVLAQAQNPLRAREVAGLLGLDGADTTVNAIRTRLERLAKSGHARRPGRGLYTVAADRPGTAG